jgi:hypothetical protein
MIEGILKLGIFETRSGSHTEIVMYLRLKGWIVYTPSREGNATLHRIGAKGEASSSGPGHTLMFNPRMWVWND